MNDQEMNFLHKNVCIATCSSDITDLCFRSLPDAPWAQLQALKFGTLHYKIWKNKSLKKLITSSNKSTLVRFQELYPHYGFTFEASDSVINYFDFKIFKGKRFEETGILHTKVYIKPTETHPLETSFKCASILWVKKCNQ